MMKKNNQGLVMKMKFLNLLKQLERLLSQKEVTILVGLKDNSRY